MDGNAQNMFHGNHQGDPYYRYDPAAVAAAAAASPRAMGPPGGYPRHRAPHPLQQQPQYPTYQPAPDNIYGLSTADQHASMGMGDLSGWGGAPSVPGQASSYPGTGLGAYVHPQTGPPTQQRQPSAQPSYRQHMPAYGQQDPQKLPYATQQSMMSSLLQQPSANVGPAGYGSLSQAQQQQQTPSPQQQQQQSQQSRLPQHYPQAPTQHPLYTGASTQGQPSSSSGSGVPSATQGYGHSPYGAPMQHQTGRASQHVGYGHAGLEQPSPYGQHVPGGAATPGVVAAHHLAAQQAGQLSSHPSPHMVSSGSQQQQQQQQQPTAAGMQHGVPPGLGAPQQQQQSSSHLLQSQQQ